MGAVKGVTGRWTKDPMCQRGEERAMSAYREGTTPERETMNFVMVNTYIHI